MRTHETTLDAAVAADRAAARAYAAHVGRLIGAVDETNRVVLARATAGADGDQLTGLLQAIREAAPHYAELVLTDGQGASRQWSGKGPAPNLRDRPYVRAHLDSRRDPLFVDEARMVRAYAGHSLLGVSRATRRGDGSVDLIAVALLDAGVFSTELKRFAEGRDSRAALVHRNGSLIAQSDRQASPPRQPGSSPLAGTLASPENPDALGWIEPVGSYPLAVIVETDRREALLPWKQRALAGILMLAIGAAVIMSMSAAQARQGRRLAEAEHRYRALTEQSLVGIFLLRDQQLLYANPRLGEILGADGSQIGSRDDLLGFIAGADRERIGGYLTRWQTAAGSAGSTRFAAAAADGSSLDLEMQGRQVIIDGQPAALVVVSDATDQAHAHRELQAMAYHDALTGLPNRALMFDRLTQTLARSHRSGGRFALMLIDLDGFKDVNDTLGHEAGDGVLRTVAERLLSCLRESDTVARMGGDEFLVILSTTPGIADAEGVARKLLHELARPIPLRLAPDPKAEPALAMVSGSIGLAFYPDHGETPDALIAAADGAMYAAKNAGKNRHAVAAMPTERTNAPRGPFIAWSPEFMIGVEVIDDDHAELFERVNDLAAAIRDGAPAAERDEALDRLRESTARHFRDEEGEMNAAGYSGIDGHARQHRELLRKLTTLEHLLDEHGPSMALKTLRDWLLLHINTSDRQYAAWLRQRQNLGAAGDLA